MKRQIIFSIIFGAFIGLIIGILIFGEKHDYCVPDSEFNRIECCVKITANGHCAVGQPVAIYNI